MASPEMIPKDTQEEVEREAPVFERVRQPQAPEREVENAFADVESLKEEFDSVKSDAEMSRDQDEYAARLEAMPDAIAEADDAIAEELSAIREEELGLLEKLNAKLRKYVGILALTSIASVSEGADIDFEGHSKQAIAAVVDANMKSDSERQFIREQSALYRDIERKVIEGKFESEQELLGFLRDVAEKYDGEVSVLYGVGGFGHMKFFQGQFALQQDSVASASDSFRKKAKVLGISELVEAHTHPKKRVESSGYKNSNVPPSLADIRSSSQNSWSDQFDNPMASESSAYGVVSTRQLVVTEKGVWEYGADYSNQYIQHQREAALKIAMDNLNPEQFGFSRDDAESYLRILQVPDDLVRKREERRVDKKGANSLFLKYSEAAQAALRGGAVIEVGKELEYEWTIEQMKVSSAAPEQQGEATAGFIRFCEERGIKMKYTPFEAIGHAVKRDVGR